MQERDKQAQTLYDYAADFQWIRMLGWSDDELRRVPVYEEATSADESLNLESVGGTSLNVSEAIDVTSGDARALHNLGLQAHHTARALAALWCQSAPDDQEAAAERRGRKARLSGAP